MKANLRLSFSSGLMAAILALPILGFELVETGNGLGLNTRFEIIAWVFAITFAATLILKSCGPMRLPQITLPG